MTKKVKCIPQTEENFYGDVYGEFEVTAESLYEIFKKAEKKAQKFFGNVPMSMEILK